jgi:hypothetical protein
MLWLQDLGNLPGLDSELASETKTKKAQLQAGAAVASRPVP